MHELSIATAILEQALEAVVPHDATRIDRIDVEVGRMRLVVPEALQTAFTAVSQGSIAQAAQLVITEVDIQAICRHCQTSFCPCPEIGHYLCPQCQQADVQIVTGHDMILTSIIAQTPEEAVRTNEDPA